MTVMRKVSAFCGRIKNGSVDTRRSINSTIYKNKSVLGEEIGTYEKF